MVATTDKWLAEVVQPAAMNVLGAQVIEMRAGSYSCRAMNNGTGTSRTSEHAYGNAVDVFSFRLNDGRNITVKDGWRGSPEEQNFLREVFVGACEHFSTVLGPGADLFHYDHFHIDLARHSKGRHICKPVIKYTPNYNLPPPDPARPYSWRDAAARQPARCASGGLSRGHGGAEAAAAGCCASRATGCGRRARCRAATRSPIMHGQPQSLDAQRRFIEEHLADAAEPAALPAASRCRARRAGR